MPSHKQLEIPAVRLLIKHNVNVTTPFRQYCADGAEHGSLKAPLFRHLAATLLVEEGIDIRMVQALLGHANLKTTEIYVRVSNHALKRALERTDILSLLNE